MNLPTVDDVKKKIADDTKALYSELIDKEDEASYKVLAEIILKHIQRIHITAINEQTKLLLEYKEELLKQYKELI